MIGRNGLNTIQWIGMGNLQFARIIQLTRTGEPGGGYIGRVRVRTHWTERWTDRRTDRRTDPQTDRRTERAACWTAHRESALLCAALSLRRAKHGQQQWPQTSRWASHMSESYNPGTDPADLSARTPCGFWSFNCQQKNNKKRGTRKGRKIPLIIPFGLASEVQTLKT